MMLIVVAGLSTMSMGSECFGLDSNPEQLYFAGDVASVWPENADGDLGLFGDLSSERQGSHIEVDSMEHAQVRRVWGTEMSYEMEHGVSLDELYDAHFRCEQPAVRLVEDVHLTLQQDAIKRNTANADLLRVVGSMAMERKRWCGLLKGLHWRSGFDAAMRVFKLLHQIIPVMREWNHFNEFDLGDMQDLQDLYQQGHMPRGNATWLGSMLGNPHGSAGLSNQQKWVDVTLPETTKEEAFTMLRQAVLAQIQLEADAYSGGRALMTLVMTGCVTWARS